jgi:hypothetical protein
MKHMSTVLKLRKPYRYSWFGGTMLEIIAGLAIFAIVLSGSIPHVQAVLEVFNEKAVAISVADMLREAKALAQRENARMYILLLPDPSRIQLAIDRIPLNPVNVPDEMILQDELPPRYSLSGPSQIIVNSQGKMLVNPDLPPQDLSITMLHYGKAAAIITVNSSGLISIKH